MLLDLRIIFLVLLFATVILYAWIFPTPGPQFLWDTLRRLLMLAAGLGTVITFALILTRQDPLPYIRLAAYYQGLEQLVLFDNAIPNNLTENLAVTKVERLDTDADDFKEWVVFYKFDKRSKNSPIQAVIYDNDRGNPPVIFPYSLRAPDRNYLSEDETTLHMTLEAVAADRNGPDGGDIDEIIVEGRNELTFFRFNQNSEIWDFPRDVPPRYEVIGFFRGNGNVVFDPTSKRVTVNDRDGWERSQLALRSVYGLQIDPQTGFETYLDPIQALGSSGDPKMAAPILATIDFFPAPPDDVYNTPFPEKIVLAFYASTCANKDDSLCISYQSNWQPANFLTDEALNNFSSSNAGYFGLPILSGNQQILVSQLRYFPQVETDVDRLESGGGRDVVTGEQAQEGLVEIMFTVGNSGVAQTARYAVRLVGTPEGAQWKLSRRISVVPPVAPEQLEKQSGDTPETFDPPLPPPPPANLPPTAIANGPYQGVVCQPLTLSAAGSSDPENGVLSYKWDFGDGAPVEQSASPTHLYAASGTFTATLNVTDNLGLSGQSTAVVTISPPGLEPNCGPAPCCQ